MDLAYGVKAVTAKRGINIVTITSNKVCGNASTFLGKVFTVLNKHKVIVDLVSISEAQVSIALNKWLLGGGESGLAKAIQEMGEFADANIKDDRAIISIIGQGMVNRKGVVARLF